MNFSHKTYIFLLFSNLFCIFASPITDVMAKGLRFIYCFTSLSLDARKPFCYNNLQDYATSPMLVTLLGIVTEVKPVHS